MSEAQTQLLAASQLSKHSVHVEQMIAVPKSVSAFGYLLLHAVMQAPSLGMHAELQSRKNWWSGSAAKAVQSDMHWCDSEH